MMLREFIKEVSYYVDYLYPGVHSSVSSMLAHAQILTQERARVKTNHTLAICIALLAYGCNSDQPYTSFDVASKYLCFNFLFNMFNDNYILLYNNLNMRSELFTAVVEAQESNLNEGLIYPLTNQDRSLFLSSLRRVNYELYAQNKNKTSILATLAVVMLLATVISVLNTVRDGLTLPMLAMILLMVSDLADQARDLGAKLNHEYAQPLYDNF